MSVSRTPASHVKRTCSTRSHERTRNKGNKGDRHCPHVGKEPTNEMRVIGAAQLHFLTSIAAAECLLLEQAIFTIVKMLLVRAGIETNPGPTSPASSTCCNTFQHFRRVENTIEKAQSNFQSKATQDTLTKKVIEIEETGKYLSSSIRKNI